MDEPLSGLDCQRGDTGERIVAGHEAEGKTIFYCSHMMDVVEKVSDRIMLINNGAIIANGTIEQLKQNNADSLEQIFHGLHPAATRCKKPTTLRQR